MEYKTPKVLEKKPVIAGSDLGTIVISSACLLLFVFTVFTSFLASLVFIAIAVMNIIIKKKYPQRGQLKMVVKHHTSVQCIRINKPIKLLIKR
ncbi:hypothetical protein [Abyssalbus ytuae]|uniref:Uncharacterized protein n=1 Tax=Abyssalbus ytuae TaxID=2926907 RepID=A0A9E7CUH4_9FLAO|nr:hypothetical protein [Abyssalbus ytuae]UOB18432.1 hypothetical protein MQE35_03870 [Abyssalbus ytuae]